MVDKIFGGSESQQSSSGQSQNFGENIGQNVGFNASSNVGSSFGSNQSSSQASSKPIDITPEDYEALRPDFAQAYQSLLSGGPQYQGQTTAGLSDQEQSFLSQIGGAAGPSSLQGAASNRLQSIINGGSNPYLEQQVAAATRPIGERLNESLDANNRRFTLAGQQTQPQGSSAFDREQRLSVRDADRQAGDVEARIRGAAYENERSRQLQASLQQPQFDQANLNKQIDGLKASALPRLIQDQGIDRGLQLFRDRINTIIAALGGAPLTSQFGTQSQSSSESSSTTGGSNVGQSLGLTSGQNYSYTGGESEQEGTSSGSSSPGIISGLGSAFNTINQPLTGFFE